MRILLEPSIYELVDCERVGDEHCQYLLQTAHLQFLSKTLNFIYDKKNNCQITLSLSTLQSYNIFNLNVHPWSQYSRITNRNEITQIYKKFMQLRPQIDNLEHYKKSSPDDPIEKFTGADSICYDEFCKHITYIYQNKLDSVVFYGRLNNLNKELITYGFNNVHIELYPIYDITDMFNCSIRKILLSNPKYKILPSINNPFPNIEISKDFINIRNHLIDSGMDRIHVYKKVGTEVALRNNYSYDSLISKINSNAGCIRVIFKSNNSPHIYASIDVRHGNLEVCDSSGKHVDEFTYDNIAQNKKDSTGNHDIKLHK